ncbi:DUF2779 domain-containing protein [Solilutibacter tolerans]|uniref:DUF2779 domain-containing protein n=1 Tax=Solilutibacter tolerans TaxID=1604334 RepID=A0A1N6N3B4_9GAMM|nr:DUF2779 domain-containing protein [Lysobacter tolerans]SIP86564.1 protein of unknown function [Lysobacter tolerans]
MIGRALSKSKLIAYRQCQKRLWLEVHRPDLRIDSAQSQAKFNAGHRVGDIARQLFDLEGTGTLIDPQKYGFDGSFERTTQLLDSPHPIFEAGFRIDGALAFADVLLPISGAEALAWKMVEVKSSTSVKDYYLEDVAIQAHIARSSGVSLVGVSVACIDSGWIYPGEEDYVGLLKETDVTDEAYGRDSEVRSWIIDAQRVVAEKHEPTVKMGTQCSTPFECGFSEYCRGLLPKANYPIDQLPGRLGKGLKALVESEGLTDLRDVPDELLNHKQLRVKQAALSGKVFFDREAAALDLKPYELPAYFMDFETIQFVVPIWKGTRPYQQIPFQFSVHRLSEASELEHHSFLDLSGDDPSLKFAHALISSCGHKGPIFAYNASFERSRIKELADRFPSLSTALMALTERIVDLLPMAREHYYHPDQLGSWSIKSVLPSLCPDLDYAQLEGVQNGGMAMDAYAEALAPATTVERKAEIERQLIAYCSLDTLALVRIWLAFSGSSIKLS